MTNIVRILTIDEGARYRVYTDTYGNHTVGIGFNMDSPSAREVWQQANVTESFDNVYNNAVTISVKSVGELFNTCVNNCKYDLSNIFPEFDTYPDYVQQALIDMVFNMGKPKFSGFTTTIQLIKDKKFNEAADHILQTLWAKQLPARSRRVSKLMKGDDTGYSL